VLFVSHGAAQVRKLCTRAICLQRGEGGYGGNVGVSGDLNFEECDPIVFNAGPSDPVWVVLG
jgi:hypothetical protein